MKWISVKNELPPNDVDVLLYAQTYTPFLCIGKRCGFQWWIEHRNSDFGNFHELSEDSTDIFTFWMHLPNIDNMPIYKEKK